jgi:hypothetical protein
VLQEKSHYTTTSEKQQLPEKNSAKSKRAFEPGEDGHHFKINHYRKIAMEATSYFLSRKIFDQKSCQGGRGGGELKCCSPENFLRIDFVGKILPLPPPKKKHGTHGATDTNQE